MNHALAWAWTLALGLVLAACQPAAAIPGAQQYSGTGPAELAVNRDGPAILRIEARRGSQPFQLSAQVGRETLLLVAGDGPVDEYRAFTFSAPDPAQLSITGDRDWEISLLPPSAALFTVLQTPGAYKGRGNAVIVIEGEYSIADFNIDRTRRIEAWAFGRDTAPQALYIKPDGHYKGKTVLPGGVDWLVVSADGPWSVKIMEPCCQIP